MRTFELNSYERQVVLGTLLGTSCVRKHPRGRNYSLYMRATDDPSWFAVKCRHLQAFARDPYVKGATWESCSNEAWNEFHTIGYRGGKKLATMEWLDSLTDAGLSVWFLDKGGVCGNKAYIRVANLGGHDVIKRYFNEVGFPCDIRKKMVVFDAGVAQKFLKLITPCFPKYLLDRPNPYHQRKYL